MKSAGQGVMGCFAPAASRLDGAIGDIMMNGLVGRRRFLQIGSWRVAEAYGTGDPQESNWDVPSMGNLTLRRIGRRNVQAA